MPLPEHLSNRHQSERRTRTIMTKGRVSSWRWCPAFCAISACSFTGEYGILGLVQQIGTCRGEAPPSCCARPFCRLKAPLGLSLLRCAAQTRTFENTLISAACKKTQGKLWQKERGLDGASPLDRMMRCSKISAAFIAVFKNSAEQNGIFTICSLRILLRWENRIRQKDKVSAGKIRTQQ